MDFAGHTCEMSYNKCELCSLQKTIDNRLHEAKRHGGGVRERVESGVYIVTPCLNEKIDSGKSHLQDLARWWRTSQGVDIPKISQFYWALFEKTRFLCFYIIKSSKKRAKIPLNLTSEEGQNIAQNRPRF